MNDNFKTKEDICAHLGDDYARFLGAIVPPIFQTSIFTLSDNQGYAYTRGANPTTEIAEKKIAALEEGEEARCFSSGMAAISASIMRVLSKDGHVICPLNAYHPTRVFLSEYLQRFGVETTFVSGTSIEEIEQAIRPNTQLIFLESPVSYVFTMQDMGAIAELAKAHGIKTIIDNTWATPLYQNPLAFGIDIVVHSASKYLGGHSDIVAGVAIASKQMIAELTQERLLYGACMDPHQSWLLLRGLRTLPVRMRQHQENAMKIATYLDQHPKVTQVLHPGLPSHPQYELGRKQLTGYTGLFGFCPTGSADAIMEMVNGLRHFTNAPSWGGFESLVTTPGVGMTGDQSKLTGIPQGLLRVSIGLENVDTLLEDLEHGLSKI
ncbi:trans-sulfuration enzyme family protein [Paenibacillus montanisoli]|uniref:homocysteine desulfhydrase n=1 Tax=Paenibacillus montanisoli TaxID=2081970 RepID=A0A328U786_9BACL|nr:PLP-dependent aspartate aminotransferase family protein [Paenibacillus montanisoli]RAP78419.1 cystathionine beta-lyase/cystathionine gamma-synthase [Paenibacillus montanisoli]